MHYAVSLNFILTLFSFHLLERVPVSPFSLVLSTQLTLTLCLVA